jgi:TolB protein
MDLNGGNRIQLTHNAEHDVPYAFSPGGTQLIYCSSPKDYVNGKRLSRIHIIDIDGSNDKILTANNFSNSSPILSPDGQRIVFRSSRELQHNNELYMMDIDGKNEERLTYNPSHDERPKFHPDGSRIVWMSVRSDVGWQVYSMDLNTREETNLSHEGSGFSPVYTPDGEYIYFTGGDWNNDTGGLYKMDKNGNGQEVIIPSPDHYEDFRVHFQPINN